MSVQNVNYTKGITAPIYDNKSGRIFCRVDVYGLSLSDLRIPDGLAPFKKAIERLGLNPDAYSPSILDARNMLSYDECLALEAGQKE